MTSSLLGSARTASTGSVPIERLEMFLRRERKKLNPSQPQTGGLQLRRVLAQYPDIFVLSEDGTNRPRHRVRLTVHFAWRSADDRVADERAAHHADFSATIRNFLSTQPAHTAPLDATIDAVAAQRGETPVRRGDFVRFLRLHASHDLHWDPSQQTIHLLPTRPWQE